MAIISPISSPLVSSVVTGRKKKTEVQSSFPTKFTKQDEERSKELFTKQEEFQNIPDWQKPGRWLLSTKPSRWTMGKVPYGSEDVLTKKFPYSMPEEELREFQSLQRRQAAAGLGPAVEDFLALKALEGTPISTREELFASLPALNRVEWNEEEEGWFTSQIKLHQGELAGELLTLPDPTDPIAVENFEDALLEELLKQQGDPRFILSRASIVRDSQAITRALQEIYGGVTPTIPEGMTDEQALELLKEITPETEIPQDELTSLSQAIQDIYIQYDKELSEIGKITEVPPPGIKQLILQPMLGPLEMLNLYNKYITRPLSYYMSRAVLPIAQETTKLPGNLDEWARQEADLIAKYNEARNEGDNPWMAASTGFEEWDVPWYQKLATEIIVDPATYIGIGVIPRTIGKLGRPGALIARMDTAFAQTANVPFDALLSKIHNLPRTPSQMALGESFRAQEAFTRTIVLQTGKHMDEVTTDEVIGVLLKTLDEGGKAGASPDMQVLYKYLMVNNPMNENEILKLSAKLGGRFTNAEDITPTAMESIHSRMEQAFFNSTRDQEEAISLILHSFGADDNIANAGIIRQYLTTRFNSPSRAFIEQQKHLTPLKISQNFKKRVNGEFLDFYGAVSKAPNAKAAAKIGAERMQRGTIGSIFTYEVDKFTNSTIVKALDSWAVRPAAKLYLGFSGYTVFNVVEAGFRSMVGGAMPGQITSSRMLRNYGWVKGKPFAWEDEVGDAVGMGILDAKEELAALRDWKSFRFWKQKVGRDLMLGEAFIRKSNQWGSIMRNSYWEKRLHHHLADIAKKDPQLSNYLTSQMNKIDRLPITPKLKTQLKRDLVTATFTPNPKSNITNLLNTVEETTLKQKEAHKIVAGIDPNSNSGTFLHDAIDSQAIFLHTDDTIKKALEIEQAHDAFLPSQIAQNFKQVKDDLIATPIKSQDDYFHMLNSIRVLSDCYQQFPTHVMETTYRLASSMKSGAEKSALWDEVLKNLDEAVEESGQVLDEIIESMKGKLPRVFRKSTKLQDQTRSLDTLIEQRRYYQSLQTELLTYRKQFFATNNKWKMKGEDWDRFYTGINEIYTRGVGKRMALRKAEWQDRINGSVFVSNPAKDFTPQQVLSTQDIGHIIGAHPNNLTQSILDNSYLQDENMFVAMVEAYAEEGGHKVTQAQIRQGYRDIWSNINIKDPQRMNSLTRKADNLEAVRLQIEMLKRTPMVSIKHRPLIESTLKSIADDLPVDEGKLLNMTQEAGDLATRDFYRTFPTYDNNTAVDQLMKFIYPFWGYEWQRPIWLTRLAVTKPVFPMTYSHYTKYSDRGYVRVPGTDLEINPLRGTVFMGGMWNLLQDFPEYCLTSDTEALTKTGWKKYNELSVGEEILGLDNKHRSTWQKIEAINVFDYDGDLPSPCIRMGRLLKGSPNHTWLTRCGGVEKKKWFEINVDNDKILTAATHVFPRNSFLTPQEAAILGWVVCDGTIQPQYHQMDILQSPKKFLLEIEKLVGKKGVIRNFVLNSKKFLCGRVHVPWEIARVLFANCPTKESLPALIPLLNKEAAEAMWDAMYKAEGLCLKQKGEVFYQNPGPVSEAFQMLSVLLGKEIVITRAKSGIENVYIHNRKMQPIRSIEPVYYKGKIWCPTTSSGTWLAKQDGVVFYTGNSSDNPVASTLFDLQQRTGFYPNILISLGWNIYETRGLPEFGALTPTPLSTMWHLAERVPGMDTHAARLRHGMGGRYWEYNVLELSTQKCQEQRQPFTGLDIWNEIQEGNIHPFADDPALEEARKSDDPIQSFRAERLLLMKQIWEDAHKDYSFNAIFIEQSGCMRYYSRPREESLKEYQAIIRDITGLTEEEQRQAWNRGYTVSQLMGRGFTPEEVELVRNTEWRLYWAGITTPIRPFVQQEYQRASREFLSNYIDLRKDISLQKRQLDLDMLNNRITFQEWKTQTDTLESKEHNAWDTLIENNSDYVTLPRTIKDRMELYKTIGLPIYGELPPPASIYLLSDLYFSLEPEEVRDVAYDGTVYLRKDWDTFYAKRALIDDTAEEWGISDQWQELKKSQYASPLDALQKEITDKYLRTYWNMSKFVLEGYNETEQDIIMQIVRGEYTPMEDTTDKALYSNYHRHVSEARERYRKMFPEADYWLRFFGYVESAQTVAAENLWLSRGRDLTLQPSYSHYLTDYPLFRSEDIALGRLKEEPDGY